MCFQWIECILDRLPQAEDDQLQLTHEYVPKHCSFWFPIVLEKLLEYGKSRRLYNRREHSAQRDYTPFLEKNLNVVAAPQVPPIRYSWCDLFPTPPSVAIKLPKCAKLLTALGRSSLPVNISAGSRHFRRTGLHFEGAKLISYRNIFITK